jgi:hypothetical protein
MAQHCGSAPSEGFTDRKECRQGPRRTASCRRGTADKGPARQAGSVPAGGNQRELHCAEPSRWAGFVAVLPRLGGLAGRPVSVHRPGTSQVHARYIFPLTCGFPAISMGGTRAAESGACAATRGPGQWRVAPPARRHDGVRPGSGGRGGHSLPATPLNLDTRVVPGANGSRHRAPCRRAQEYPQWRGRRGDAGHADSGASGAAGLRGRQARPVRRQCGT